MSNEKRRKTFNLRFSKYELLHLRDLFSILLPTAMQETISQRLASTQNRILVETMLWQKIIKACEEAEVPLGDDAPDFVVSSVSTPEISVFEIAQDPDNDGFYEQEDDSSEDENDDEEE